MATNKPKDAVSQATDAATDAMEEFTENVRDFIVERPIAVAVGCFVLGYLWGKIHG